MRARSLVGRWADIVTRVRNAVGDLSESTARSYVLDAARTLNAEARYLTTATTVGSTTADVGEYALEAGVVDVYSVLVDGTPYDLATGSDVENLDSTRSYLSGSGGVFAPGFTSDGTPTLLIRPVPEQSGLAITGRHVVRLTEPDWTDGDPPFPEDFDKDIIHGAVSAGLAEQDERLESAQWHEDRFNQAVGRLRSRKNGRVGKGPVRIRLLPPC